MLPFEREPSKSRLGEAVLHNVVYWHMYIVWCMCPKLASKVHVTIVQNCWTHDHERQHRCSVPWQTMVFMPTHMFFGRSSWTNSNNGFIRCFCVVLSQMHIFIRRTALKDLSVLAAGLSAKGGRSSLEGWFLFSTRVAFPSLAWPYFYSRGRPNLTHSLLLRTEVCLQATWHQNLFDGCPSASLSCPFSHFTFDFERHESGLNHFLAGQISRQFLSLRSQTFLFLWWVGAGVRSCGTRTYLALFVRSIWSSPFS